LELKHIQIDGEDHYCDKTSLQSGPFPKEIKFDGKVVLSLHVPHHFSLKLAYMIEDFTSITEFKETNSSGLPFGQTLVSFFETTQHVHYSVLAMSVIIIVILTILLCCISYFKCPSCLQAILCCCTTARCGLKTTIENQISRRANLPYFHSTPDRANYAVNDPRARVQLLSELNQNPAETSVETSFSQNNQDAGQSGARTDQNAPIMKSQAEIFNQVGKVFNIVLVLGVHTRSVEGKCNNLPRMHPIKMEKYFGQLLALFNSLPQLTQFRQNFQILIGFSPQNNRPLLF
jgi:hypothetical protein